MKNIKKSNNIHKDEFLPEIQGELNNYSNKCWGILQNNEKHLQKFKEIYKEQFGIELSDKEALEYSVILLNFVKLIISKSKRQK